MRFVATVGVICLQCLCHAASAPGPLPPSELKTEYLENPLGIDTASPRFLWWMNHEERNQGQTAYQILVASTLEKLAVEQADLWDSGKVESDNSVHVAYEGKPLESYRRYYWKVRTWDTQDRPSEYSEAAWFEMALLAKKDFKAAWIQGDEDVADSKGYHGEYQTSDLTEQWVMVEMDEAAEIVSFVIHPATLTPALEPKPGYGFPVRFRLLVGNHADTSDAVVVYETPEDLANPGAQAVKHEVKKATGRCAWLAATKLGPAGEGTFALALAEIELLDAAGKNVALHQRGHATTLLNELGWGRTKLLDGVTVSQAGEVHSPLMRKAFKVEKPVARARAYASGLGYYELYLNGQRVGDHVLDPATTVYDKRTLYSAYDVTDQVKYGDNAAGLMLGHGWWPTTAAGWLQLRIEYEDGSVDTIVTDETWKYSSGPIVFESLYHGETYDARLEKAGWNEAGYDDSGWRAVRTMANAPVTLAVQSMPAIRITQKLAPIAMVPQPDGSTLVDFGQNHTGWVRMQVEGPAGTEVTLRHTERVHDDGTPSYENLRSAKATERYILKGGGVESYAPRFTQHGYRYVQISGYPGELKPENLVAEVAHTFLPRIGNFESSSDVLNGTYRITNWSERSNAMGIPTDCPQRDERMGWMGDAHLAAEVMLMDFNAVPFYENWLKVIAHSQKDGFVPDTAPRSTFGNQDGDPAWAVAYPLITYDLYRYAGDVRAVEEHYPNLVAWFGTLEDHAKDGIVAHSYYGDWVSADQPSPKELVSTGIYYLTAKVLKELAPVAGHKADVARFDTRMKEIAAAFHTTFYDAGNGYYGNGSQFSQVWPLYLGIVPEDVKPAVIEHLVKNIMDEKQGHLATGILGTKYLFPVLVDAGRQDVAYTVALQETYPGFGYMLSKGATTLWELWNSDTGDPAMNSHNHVMFGSVVGWMYGDVAGIGTLPAPGYANVTLAPKPGGDLEYAEAQIKTVRGRITSGWKKDGEALIVRFIIPPNVKARVVVPTMGKEESSIKVDFEEAKPEPVEGGVAFELGSGEYNFRVE